MRVWFGTTTTDLPLIERKGRLRSLVPKDGPALYVDHIAGEGVALYRSICERDLEGVVAKKADGLYTPDETSWVKIRNHYLPGGPPRTSLDNWQNPTQIRISLDVPGPYYAQLGRDRLTIRADRLEGLPQPGGLHDPVAHKRPKLSGSASPSGLRYPNLNSLSNRHRLFCRRQAELVTGQERPEGRSRWSGCQ